MDLIRVLLQPLGVILELRRLDHLHAALNAALKRALLVIREIVSGAAAQNIMNIRQRVTRLFRVEGAPIAHIGNDASGYVFDRELQIDKARRHGAQRHLRKARPRNVRPLRDCQPAILLYRLDAESTVMTTPGEHHPDRMLVLVLGERIEEHVYRRTLAVGGSGAAQPKPALSNSQNGAGW